MSQPSGLADISIVIPVFNQLAYTKGCVETLNQAGVADAQIIVINNASTDGTAEFLATHPQIRAVNNPVNTGCGPAWTQGSQMSQTDWTVVLNNDVLVPAGCLEALKDFAVENHYDIACPAMREGEANYDWRAHAAVFMEKMKPVRREAIGHGVCFMVHRRVFAAIGYFNNFGGYEDDDFFRRARHGGFKLATIGGAWLHHYGSVTQKGMKFKNVMTREHRARYRAAIGQTWLKHKVHLLRHGLRSLWWKQTERRRFGNTLKERQVDGVIEYC